MIREDAGQGRRNGGGQKADAEGRWLARAATPAERALRQAFDEAAQEAPVGAGDREGVWRGVREPWTARRPARRWAWPVFALSLGAVAAIALVAGRAPGPPVAHLPATGPSVRGPEVVPLPPDADLLRSASERARHRLPRGVDAELAPHSTLAVGSEETGPEVRSGRVRFAVPPQPPGRRYAVRAGAYRVTVVGTVFDVDVEGNAVGVSVERGVVTVEEFATGHLLRRLERGDRWQAGSDVPAEDPAAPAERPGARAPARRLPLARAGEGAPALLAEAREARRTGDARRALALYERLADQGGALAESALYEVGAIDDEDLHDPRHAVVAWERYRERFPRGLLRAEADLSIVGALARLGETDRALGEARAFLRRHPTSERRGEVARVAGDLARTRGDCRAAVELYDLAARGPLSTGDADDAAFQRAACLVGSRDPRAGDALREYGARFPSGRHAGEAARLRPPAAEPR